MQDARERQPHGLTAGATRGPVQGEEGEESLGPTEADIDALRLQPQACNAQRSEVVFRASVAKFTQNAELGAYLRGTGDRVLVEASPTDRIWGIGLAAEHAHATEPSKWRGLNLLGFALMRARSQLLAAR